MTCYERTNARLSSPVNLRARFFEHQVFFDPYEIERVEIWKHSEEEKTGGVLVDVIDGSNVIQDRHGHYRVVWDPYLECPGSTVSPMSPTSPGDGLVSPADPCAPPPDWGDGWKSCGGSPTQGPGSPGQDPNDPAKIEANTCYFDTWFYRKSPGCELINTVGLNFYLYPDGCFVDSGFDRFRFEIKYDRRHIIKGEQLDIRGTIIPLPLYVAHRDPLTNFLLPICKVEVQWLDARNNEMLPWSEVVFTGREAIIPTDQIARNPIGAYLMNTRLLLPNGQKIQWRKQPIQVED